MVSYGLLFIDEESTFSVHYLLVKAMEVHVGVRIGRHLVLLGGLLTLFGNLILGARKSTVSVEFALAVVLVFFKVGHNLVHEVLP